MRRDLLAVMVLAGILAGILHRENARGDFRRFLEKPVPAGFYAEGSPSVFFIGNSFTSVNDLPILFARLARSLGDKPGVEGYAPGGQTFAGHAKDSELLKKISARAWDFVVLQEQSQRPAFSPKQVETDTIVPALALDAMIHASHPGTKVVFYETWGRKNGDQANCKDLPNICTYEGQQKRLDESYALMAERSSGILVPVGEAWAKVRAEHPEIELYAADGIHPSEQGTYLAACVFYAVLFHKRLTGAERFGLSEKETLILQRAAEQVVFGTT